MSTALHTTRPHAGLAASSPTQRDARLTPSPIAAALLEISLTLRQALATLTFAPPVSCTYQPLDYAWEPYAAYVTRYGSKPRKTLLLGMNPGPFGMAQTGVPFGEVASVRDWLQISGSIARPLVEHPKRPVLGFGCSRSEVSGRRLWGWAATRFRTPEAFFDQAFVINYCPLLFVEESGRNRTPDQLPAAERAALFSACDQALRSTVSTLQAEVVVGIGKFAEARARTVLADLGVSIGCVPHPSPASPAANRGWDLLADEALRRAGLVL
jgi:single-strand selective monofunctional uracil DNA glycosylase